MKRFLVPIDLSEYSMPVCRYATQLSGMEKTELYLFHIFPDQIMMPDSSFPAGIDSDAFMNNDYVEGIREQAEIKMTSFKNELQQLVEKENRNNISLKSMISGGDPEWEINAICDETKPYIIIMGTRGEGKKGFLEGSMAEKIMSRATVPVLAVPESYAGFRLKNIMYATDFSEVDFLKIEKLFTLFSQYEFVVHVVHLLLSGKEQNETSRMDELKLMFENKIHERNVRFHLIESENKKDALKKFTQENAIDLVAFISHKSNFFTSLFRNKITKKDFFKLELPMLAMHEE